MRVHREPVSALRRQAIMSAAVTAARARSAEARHLAAEARRVAPPLKASVRDGDRYAGWLLTELTDRLDPEGQ